jgi:hypothetical protein
LRIVASPGDETFVFSIDAVRRAIGGLVANPIHEHFAGYLAVLRAMRLNNGAPAKSADIVELHERYLKAQGAPAKSPYIRPFKSRGQGLELFNSNVAGSYAPSSIRTKGKLTTVLDVQGSGKSATYGVHPNHASAALTSLLSGHKVPATSLAAFLYRDYGFKLEKREVARVRTLFRDEFGLRASVHDEQTVFNTLFEDDSANFKDTDLEGVSAGG